MNYDIQRHTAVITTFKGSTCGINLQDYDDVVIRYNKKCDHVTIEGTKTVKEVFAVPMTTIVAVNDATQNEIPKPPVEEKTAPVEKEEYGRKGELVGDRGRTMGPVNRAKATTRKKTSYDAPLAKMSVEGICDMYMRYRKGAPMIQLSSTYRVKKSTLYNWASMITRIRKNPSVKIYAPEKIKEAVKHINTHEDRHGLLI